MTLRLRLVLGLLALSTFGLTAFGVATYEVYARAEYGRLDDQIRSSVPIVGFQARESAGLETGPRPSGNRFPDGSIRRAPSIVVPPGTYGELRSSTGAVLGRPVQFSTSDGVPDLPKGPTPAPNGHYFDTGSATGSGGWRVYVTNDRVSPNLLVVAVPLTEVRASLRRLVLIETAAVMLLLSILAAGSWLILRRGLRPLELMATTARSITSGDLSQRVDVAPHTEVGELGAALNTMLGEIEGAFREREATEQRLRQFLADASHELRTPLTSIQGFAELFRLGEDQDHVDLPVILRRIEEESARMKVLVEDLLLLARLDETRPSERLPVDLAVLAADACSDAVASDPTRPVSLHAPEPAMLLGDTDHLRQAIGNLVSNALHHTPPGTPIEVGADLVDGDAVVTVRDHGPGLDEAARAHVFDRFWQADDARAGTRSGLGLAIVEAIAHEHGGHATAGNADGGGAIFTLRLPVTAAGHGTITVSPPLHP
jgi:two-component system OmpR family sensor kinase